MFSDASFTTAAAPGVPATLSVLTIWNAPTAFSAASFVGIVTGLWRPVFKEQRLLSQDCLVPQLLLQQICEELSVKSASPVSKLSCFSAASDLWRAKSHVSAASFAWLAIGRWRAILQWVASPYSGSSGSAADSTTGLWKVALQWAVSPYSESSGSITGSTTGLWRSALHWAASQYSGSSGEYWCGWVI